MRDIMGQEMPPKKSDAPVPGSGRPWQAPRVAKLPLAPVTKAMAHGLDARTASARRLGPAPPAGPSSKLGFSFEWSLPLSIRTED